MQSGKYPAEWDGLQRQEVRGLDAVYLRPQAGFSQYTRVMIDPVQVAFSKDWDPNDTRDITRRLDADDLKRIKDTLSGMVRDGFARELQRGGYTLAETADAGTLRLVAGIVDLYINAPDIQSAGRVRTYTTEAGRMTLVLEAHDGLTGQLLARVVDARTADYGAGTLQWTTSVSNQADAELMINAWARKLRNGLDRLHGKAE